MANELDPLDLPHRMQLPQVCCACLGPKELTHRVSSFYGADGKSVEAQFDVPMCRACQARMLRRERIAYAIAGVVAAGSFLLITPLSPVPKEAMPGWLATANGVVFFLALLAFFLVGIGRPFEPASYQQGRFRFRNPDYQRQFEALNAESGPS